MRVKKNPHGIAIYLSLGEAKLLKNILTWSAAKLLIHISPISYRFLKKLNSMLVKHYVLFDSTPTPPEYTDNG